MSGDPYTEVIYFFIDRTKWGMQLQKVDLTKELNRTIEAVLRVSYSTAKNELLPRLSEGLDIDDFINRCAVAVLKVSKMEMETEGKKDPKKSFEVLNQYLEVLDLICVTEILGLNREDLLSDRKLKKAEMESKPCYAHVAINWYRLVDKAMKLNNLRWG